MKGYLIKVPEGMLDHWRAVAAARGVPVSQMIREAVNKDIDSDARDSKPFGDNCGMAVNHSPGTVCQWCGGSR